MNAKVKFPKAKPINWSKYIEPKKQVFNTRNGITIAELKPKK